MDEETIAILGPDALRDMFALIRAALREDTEGLRVVAANCADPATTVSLLAQMVADHIGGPGVTRAEAEQWLTDTQRNAGLMT